MERANSYNPGARSGQLSSVISSIATNYYPQLQLQLHTTTITTSTTTTIAMKKALRETQTLHAGCSKAEPKILPRRRRPSRVAGQPKFNQLEMVTTFTNKPSLVRIDAQFRVIVVTDPQTHTPHHRQDRLQYIAPQLASMQCNYYYYYYYNNYNIRPNFTWWKINNKHKKIYQSITEKKTIFNVHSVTRGLRYGYIQSGSAARWDPSLNQRLIIGNTGSQYEPS